MRIGGITKDNYMEYLKLLGVKNTQSLDDLWDESKIEEFDHSYEARNARLVAAGHEDGMLIREGDESWRKIVPISDDIKNQLIATVKRQFLTNGNGMSTANDGDEIGAIMKSYRSNIAPKDRLAVTWTLGQVVQRESERLVEFVKANDPTWDYGKPFDKSIFENYISGGIDIKI